MSVYQKKYTGEATMCWSIFIVVSFKATPLQQKLTYLTI